MHEIQMLGLLHHDVLSSIELPFLPEPDSLTDVLLSTSPSQGLGRISKAEADKFDCDIFDLSVEHAILHQNSTRNSQISSVGSFRSNNDSMKRSMSTRTAESSISRIPPIEESPLPAVLNLAPDDLLRSGRPEKRPAPAGQLDGLSSSP